MRVGGNNRQQRWCGGMECRQERKVKVGSEEFFSGREVIFKGQRSVKHPDKGSGRESLSDSVEFFILIRGEEVGQWFIISESAQWGVGLGGFPPAGFV